MVRLKDYLQVMQVAMQGIADKIYLKERPQAVTEKVKSFIVVDISSYVNNHELDPSGDYDYYTGQVYISIFVRDKETSKAFQQVDINKMDALVQKAFARFPIIDKEHSIKIRKPRVMLSASDEDGFHYTLISASLTTYF